MPILALLKLVPLKDWLYVAAIVAIIGLFSWYTVHERHIGAAHELAAVTKASDKAKADAEKLVKDLTDQHATDVAKIEDTYEHALATADSQHASDLQRLRNADAARRAGTMLQGASSNSPQTDGGAAGLSPLESVSAELADALRRDDSALTACYADRDSLTGK